MSLCVESPSSPLDTHPFPRLEAFGQMGGRLYLHFDVNKTLLATDLAGGKDDPALVIQELMAERVFARWTEDMAEPISYHEYVRQLHPGDKYAQEVRDKRFAEYAGFVEKFAGTRLGQYLKDEFGELSNLLGDSEVFESFFHCVERLEDMGVVTTVVLRTFGKDLPRVQALIQGRFPEAVFAEGRMDQGKLKWQDEELENPAEWVERLRAHRWVAIQDNFADWKSGNCQAEAGKRIPFPLGEPWVATFGFDDNLNQQIGDPENIMIPAPIDGELSLDKAVEEGKLLQVDTVRAIKELEYFLKLMETSLGSDESVPLLSSACLLVEDPWAS